MMTRCTDSGPTAPRTPASQFSGDPGLSETDPVAAARPSVPDAPVGGNPGGHGQQRGAPSGGQHLTNGGGGVERGQDAQRVSPRPAGWLAEQPGNVLSRPRSRTRPEVTALLADRPIVAPAAPSIRSRTRRSTSGGRTRRDRACSGSGGTARLSSRRLWRPDPRRSPRRRAAPRRPARRSGRTLRHVDTGTHRRMAT